MIKRRYMFKLVGYFAEGIATGCVDAVETLNDAREYAQRMLQGQKPYSKSVLVSEVRIYRLGSASQDAILVETVRRSV